MARRTKDEAERTRNAILNAAEKVFYAHGVARTSLEQIARRAKVTRGAVYWHFSDKLALCEAMLKRVFLPQEDLLERLDSEESNTPLDDLKKACCHSIMLIATDKQRQRVISTLMFRCEYVEEMATIMTRRRECKEHMQARFEQMFERAKKLKMLSPLWTPRTAALCVQALVNGLITAGLEGRKAFNLADAGPKCIEAFFKSLSAK